MEFVDRINVGDKSGIYLIRNKVNGKAYVGQTKQRFIKRFFHHVWKLRKGTHDNKWLQSAFNKYGEDSFEFVVKEIIVGDSEFYNDEEIRIIKEYRSKGICYNLSDGGDGAHGVKPSQEQIRKLAEINKALNTGKKASEETKRKMSETRKAYYKEHPKTHESIMKSVAGRRQGLICGEYKTQKITPEIVQQIQELLMLGWAQKDVARKFGITQTNVSAIKNGRSWSFVEIDGWNEWRKERHRSTLCQASKEEGATTILQRSTAE